MTTASIAASNTSPAQKSFVYVIGHDGSGVVKIGKADDVSERLAFIQRMSPVKLRVLAQHDGGFVLETALHKWFDPIRLHGEWFDFEDADPIQEVAAAVRLIEESRRHQATRRPRSTRKPPPPPMARPMDPDRTRQISEVAAKMRAAKTECDDHIVAAYEAGEAVRQIALAAGLSPSAVSNIVARRGTKRPG